MIACASACVSLSAFANTTNTWFSASATGSGTNLTNVAISGDCTVADSKFNLDNEFSSRLVFTPDAAFTATNMSDGVVKITATAVLTPSDVSDLTTENLTDAKAGLAVGVGNNGADTNFYGFAGASGSQAWTKLTGTPSADGQTTTFTIILDYRTHKVQFVVADEVLSAATGGATSFDFAAGTDSLVSIDAFGSGSISTLNSGYEVAVVAYDNKKYGSVADAIAAGGTAANIKDVGASGDISATSEATCGLPVAVCKALGISTTASAADAPAVKVVPADNDAETGNIKLQLDTTGLTLDPGVVVKFSVEKGDTPVTGSPFAADAIMIPLGESCAGEYVIKPTDVGAASN